MKNILIVTHHYLSGNGGGVFASRAYINAIATVANNVTLLVPYKPGRGVEKILSKVHVIPVPYDKPRVLKLVDLALGRVNRYGKVFSEFMSQNNFDIVVFDNSKASFKLIDIAHHYGCKVITIHHNYEYEYNRDNYHGIVKYLSLTWVKKFESEAVRKSDLNLTLTVQDKCLLSKHYGGEKPIEVLGCFEYENSKEQFLPLDNMRSGNRFVITGNLSSVQTDASLLKWLAQYYPLLKREYPDAELTIAGKDPSSQLRKMCKNLNIRLIPSPKDMKMIIADSDYYICPTNLGGGLKLRIMDGLRAGLPVLTHEVSARGYDAFRNKCLFSYSDTTTFVSALKSMCDCSLTSSEISNLYQSLFSFEAGVNRFYRIIEKI